MEAFSLLKYWKKGAGAGGGGGDSRAAAGRTPVFAAVENQGVESDEDGGPFFDLELTGVAEENEGGGERNDSGEGEDGSSDDEEGNDDDDDGVEGNEFDFTVSSGSSTGGGSPKDRDPSLSPSDDLFFKGKLVCKGSEANPKKLAAKFRVFMLRFKKLKSAAERGESNGSTTSTPKSPPQQRQNQREQSKFFTVKFKVEEAPIVSLFTRDNSSRIPPTAAAAAGDSKPAKQTSAAAAAGDSVSDERRFSKDVLMQKYLKMVKPLYVRASKRYGEKVRFSGQLSLGPPPPATHTAAAKIPPAKSVSFKSAPEASDEPESQTENAKNLGNMPAVLRVVCKRLGQSRSAAVAAAPSAVVTKRRDDSLLEQQDGIQGAILHCKRSFNGVRDSENTHLSRTSSDPSHEKSMDLSRKSAEEALD